MEPEAGKGHRYHPFRIGRSEDSHNLTTHIELNRVILPTFHLLDNHADTLDFWGRGKASPKRFAEGDSMFTTDKGGYGSNLILPLQCSCRNGRLLHAYLVISHYSMVCPLI